MHYPMGADTSAADNCIYYDRDMLMVEEMINFYGDCCHSIAKGKRNYECKRKEHK